MEIRPLVTLTRMETSDEGTFGKLRFGELRLYAGELPWRGNAVGKSCILPGDYLCEPYQSKRFGECFRLQDVPGRTAILMHPANWVGDADKGFKTDVEGCIAPGEARGFVSGQDIVARSKPALLALWDAVDGKPFTLRIIDATGGRAGGALNEPTGGETS